LFAATYPERTSALVLVDGYARISAAPDYVPGLRQRLSPAEAEQIRAGWGRGMLLQLMAPEESRDPALRRAFAEYESLSASPGMAVSMLRMLYESDVRHVLPAVRVPTLIVSHSASARIPAVLSGYLAEHIAGARRVEVPGSANLIWAGDQDRVLAEIQEFLTGMRPHDQPDRVLATVLFTDIVDSTRLAAQVGDAAWRDLLAKHHALVRTELERHRGREVDTTGDGFLATFDGPARAIRCAAAIRDALRSVGLQVRAGLHTGEIERMDGDIGGLAVHIGARVAGLARAGEVLVSGTVKDLVVGSGIEFDDRGTHELKGVPGEWHLWSAWG
jgi:class 3 adenylate cyclase